MHTELIIIENCIDDEVKNKIAHAVLTAQDIRENSFSDKKTYKLSHIDAANAAVKLYKLDTFWSYVIEHWNHFHWNDIQNWAECIIIIDNNL